MLLQPRVTGRDATGLAISFHPTNQVNAPAIWKYCGNFEVKDGLSNSKAWALVVIEDGKLIAPGALSDADVQIIPETILDTPLTTQQQNRVQSWLNKSDLAVTVTSGMTLRQVLALIGVALGHTADFVLGLRV